MIFQQDFTRNVSCLNRKPMQLILGTRDVGWGGVCALPFSVSVSFPMPYARRARRLRSPCEKSGAFDENTLWFRLLLPSGQFSTREELVGEPQELTGCGVLWRRRGGCRPSFKSVFFLQERCAWYLSLHLSLPLTTSTLFQNHGELVLGRMSSPTDGARRPRAQTHPRLFLEPLCTFGFTLFGPTFLLNRAQTWSLCCSLPNSGTEKPPRFLPTENGSRRAGGR